MKAMMRTTSWLSFALALAAQAPAQARPLSPDSDWRLKVQPTQVRSEPAGAFAIPGILGEGAKPWAVFGLRSATIELELELDDDEGLVIALEARNRGDTPVALQLRRGRKKVAQCALKITREASESFLGKEEAEVARLTLTAPPGRGGSFKIELRCRTELDLALTRVRFFRVREDQRCDYWYFTGDALNTLVEPEVIEAAIIKAFPDADPYVVVEARRGKTASQLLKELPEVLERHRYARYFAIHIGVAEMTRGRSIDKIATAIGRPLGSVLKKLSKRGKVPILARLHYRKVKESAPDFSRPYNLRVIDPLIKRYCPDFYDPKTERGLVDFYTFYRRNKSYLAYNGTEPSWRYAETWGKVWLDEAASLVYRRPRQGPP